MIDEDCVKSELYWDKFIQSNRAEKNDWLDVYMFYTTEPIREKLVKLTEIKPLFSISSWVSEYLMECLLEITNSAIKSRTEDQSQSNGEEIRAVDYKTIEVFFTQGIGGRILQLLQWKETQMNTYSLDYCATLHQLFAHFIIHNNESVDNENNRIEDHDRVLEEIDKIFGNSFSRHLKVKSITEPKIERPKNRRQLKQVKQRKPMQRPNVTITELPNDIMNSVEFAAFRAKQFTFSEVALSFYQIIYKSIEDDTLPFDPVSPAVIHLRHGLKFINQVVENRYYTSQYSIYIVKIMELILFCFHKLIEDNVFTKYFKTKSVINDFIKPIIITSLQQTVVMDYNKYHILYFSAVFTLMMVIRNWKENICYAPVKRGTDHLFIELKKNDAYIIEVLLELETNCEYLMDKLLDCLYSVIEYCDYKMILPQLHHTNGNSLNCGIVCILVEYATVTKNRKNYLRIMEIIKDNIRCCCIVNANTFKKIADLDLLSEEDKTEHYAWMFNFIKYNNFGNYCKYCKKNRIELNDQVPISYENLVIKLDRMEIVLLLTHIGDVKKHLPESTMKLLHYGIISTIFSRSLNAILYQVEVEDLNMEISIANECLELMKTSKVPAELLEQFLNEENLKAIEGRLTDSKVSFLFLTLIRLASINEHSHIEFRNKLIKIQTDFIQQQSYKRITDNLELMVLYWENLGKLLCSSDLGEQVKNICLKSGLNEFSLMDSLKKILVIIFVDYGARGVNLAMRNELNHPKCGSITANICQWNQILNNVERKCDRDIMYSIPKPIGNFDSLRDNTDQGILSWNRYDHDIERVRDDDLPPQTVHEAIDEIRNILKRNDMNFIMCDIVKIAYGLEIEPNATETEANETFDKKLLFKLVLIIVTVVLHLYPEMINSDNVFDSVMEQIARYIHYYFTCYYRKNCDYDDVIELLRVLFEVIKIEANASLFALSNQILSKITANEGLSGVEDDNSIDEFKEGYEADSELGPIFSKVKGNKIAIDDPASRRKKIITFITSIIIKIVIRIIECDGEISESLFRLIAQLSKEEYSCDNTEFNFEDLTVVFSTGNKKYRNIQVCIANWNWNIRSIEDFLALLNVFKADDPSTDIFLPSFVRSCEKNIRTEPNNCFIFPSKNDGTNNFNCDTLAIRDMFGLLDSNEILKNSSYVMPMRPKIMKSYTAATWIRINHSRLYSKNPSEIHLISAGLFHFLVTLKIVEQDDDIRIEAVLTKPCMNCDDCAVHYSNRMLLKKITDFSIAQIGDRWVHLAVALNFSEKFVNISIIIDGEVKRFKLPIALPSSANEKYDLLCIGQTSVDPDNYSFRLHMSNVLMFNSYFDSVESLKIFNLLGPDCVSFVRGQARNIYLEYVESSIVSVGEKSVLTEFCKTFCGAFKVLEATTIQAYEANQYLRRDSLGLLCVGSKPLRKEGSSIQQIICKSGGISTVMVLFARVVELTRNSLTQAISLRFLLTTAHSSPYLYAEFDRNHLMNLISNVIQTDKCINSVHLVRAILEVACYSITQVKDVTRFTWNVFNKNPITFPKLITIVLENFVEWSKLLGPNESARLLDTVLLIFTTLIDNKNIWYLNNLKYLTEIRIFDLLMKLFKLHFGAFKFKAKITEYGLTRLPIVLREFAGAPPNKDAIIHLLEFIVLLHPKDCTVTVNANCKIYFNISNDPPEAEPLPNNQIKPALNRRISDSSMSSQIIPQNLDRGTFNSIMAENIARLQNCNTSEESLYNNDNFLTNEIINPRNLASMRMIQNFTPRNRETLKLARNRRKIKMQLKETNIQSLSCPLKTYRQHFIQHRLRRFRGSTDQLNSDILTTDYTMRCSRSYRSSTDPPEWRFFENPEQNWDTELQILIIKMVTDFITIIPDITLTELCQEKDLLLLITAFVNNEDPTVRISALNLLVAVYNRKKLELPEFNDNHFFYQFANQFSLFTATESCVTAVRHWMYAVEIGQEPEEFMVTNTPALHILIALLGSCKSASLYEVILEDLTNVYNYNKKYRQLMLDGGLLCVVTKSLQYTCRKPDIYSRVLEKIKELLRLIAILAVISGSSLSILWDILHYLKHLTFSTEMAFVAEIRKVTVYVLSEVIDNFLQKSTRQLNSLNFRYSASMLHLDNPNLRANDVKMRFEMTVDKLVQFFITISPNYILTDVEITTVRKIVNLVLSGFPNCHNILVWGLAPARPLEVQLYILQSLKIFVDKRRMQPLGCDFRSVRILTYAFLKKKLSLLDQSQSQIVTELYDYLNPQSAKVFHWEIDNIVAEIQLLSDRINNGLKGTIQRTMNKFNPKIEKCKKASDSLVDILLKWYNKGIALSMSSIETDYKTEYEIWMMWKFIMQKMTHQGAPWYLPSNGFRSWEIDQTEGPDKIRIRLKPSNIEIPERFFKDAKPKLKSFLGYLLNEFRNPVIPGSNKDKAFHAKIIPIDNELDGDITVSETNILITCTEFTQLIYKDEIKEVIPRHYQHSRCGLELILESNKSVFLVMPIPQNYETLLTTFKDKINPYMDEKKLKTFTQKWKEGSITNWNYLMLLNDASGRMYQDIMQYPVLPWIIADYMSNKIDLKNPIHLRKLKKPISIQMSETEEHFRSSYGMLEATFKDLDESAKNILAQPYHYGSLYSNSGIVLHYLVRLLPFTNYFLNYQDNNFDLPDRTFHSMYRTWNLASNESTTDVKELIPEFFFLPEMFENIENFNFGVKQSGEVVSNVFLPPWAKTSRDFIFIQKQALESNYVRKNLCYWIDLIFGFRQKGKHAIDALNVFHPATYPEIIASRNSLDNISQTAVHTMIRTYGQMPKQLFKTAHPEGTEIAFRVNYNHETVDGLRWGHYAGSPELGYLRVKNVLQFGRTCGGISHIITSDIIYLLPEYSCLVKGIKGIELLEWGKYEEGIHLRPIDVWLTLNQTTQPLVLYHEYPMDYVVTCHAVHTKSQIWCGHKSGLLTVFSYSNSYHGFSFKTNDWSGPIVLRAHQASITAIRVCSEFNTTITGDSNSTIFIWDMNTLEQIRKIPSPYSNGEVSIGLITMSTTLGDFAATYCYSSSNKTVQNMNNVEVYTINGRSVGRIESITKVTALEYSYIKEGTGVNVLAGGFQNGIVNLWSSWDLRVVQQYEVCLSPIQFLIYTRDQFLIIGTEENKVYIMDSAGLKGSVPDFPQIQGYTYININNYQVPQQIV